MSQRLVRIRSVRRRFTGALTVWSVGSMVVGSAIWSQGEHPMWLALGIQFVVWGAIDLVFAFMGLAQVRRADATEMTPEVVERETNEAQKLARALRISHGMNYVWMTIGVALAIWAGTAEYPGGNGSAGPLWGHALGVLIQGGYLLLQDWWFDHSLNKAMAEM